MEIYLKIILKFLVNYLGQGYIDHSVCNIN